MKTKKFLGLSVVVHLALIGIIVALFTLPTKEVEEEVVLELALNTPQEVQESTVKPIPTPTMAPAKKKEVSQEHAEVLPMQPQVKVTKPIVQQVKSEAVTVAQKTPELQKAQPVEVAKLEPVIPPAPPLPTPKPSVEEEYLDNHLSTIRDVLIKYRKYPNQAVRLKQEGSARVSFRLKSNGDVEDIVIQNSSGYETLDEDAKALIEKTAHYFPKPPKTIRITVPLKYTLKAAA